VAKVGINLGIFKILMLSSLRVEGGGASRVQKFEILMFSALCFKTDFHELGSWIVILKFQNSVGLLYCQLLCKYFMMQLKTK
jgi:hypothetical protein